MASYVRWGRGRDALPAMRQGRVQEEDVKESRRNQKCTNMIREKSTWKPAGRRETGPGEKGAVAQESA